MIHTGMNLNTVEKPVRYIGNEWNAVTSKPEATLRFGIAYPDVYEVGMSYLGLQILYGLLNEQPWLWCERVFAPWPDLEQKLKEHSLYLGTVESDTPLQDLDLLGFSLQHEMLYTNVLAMLDLGGIPLLSKDRRDTDPLVLAGGPCAYNPMPMVNFIDAFVIGEGEEVILELSETVRRLKTRGKKRAEILQSLAKIEGIFVPALYREESNRLGERFPRWSTVEGVPDVVRKRLVMDFEHSYYPTRQIVPNTKIVHHRLALEVMRGCPGGCRFCQAGYTDRPVRERSPQRLLQDAEQGLQQTGFNEVGLLSLSTADYTQLPGLCSGMIQQYLPQKVALSLPSLRIDSFPSRVTQEIGKVRGTGLTFAPEAGTERLRWAINKLIHDEDIYTKVRESVTSGQDTIKFYFMVGLPTETDDDLQGIVDMVIKIKQILREEGHSRAKIHVGLSPFVPKPHTAYQWYGQISKDEITRRVKYIARWLKAKKIKVNWHDPETSLVESALARGDARVGAAIQHAYEQGSRFDEWGEHFDFGRWERAFEAQGLSLQDYAAKQYEKDDPLPWDAISIRVDKRYLWREWEKTFREKESRHCGNEMCRVCKVCDSEQVVTIHAAAETAPASKYNMEHDLAEHVKESLDRPAQNPCRPFRYRLQFRKFGRLVFASHHDLMMLMESLFRRAGVQLAFTEGFHPHAKILFASPLPVGMESRSDYLDITTLAQYGAESLLSELNQSVPEGLLFTACCDVSSASKKLTALVNAFKYEVECSIHEQSLDEGWKAQIEETLLCAEIRERLNLVQSSFHPLSGSPFRFTYTCKVNGGKYTKAETVLDVIREVVPCSIQIDKCTRLDIFFMTRDGEYEPVMKSGLGEPKPLCNAES